MRPTWALWRKMAESSPGFRSGAQYLGMTPAQAAAQIFDRFAGFRSQGERDALLAQFTTSCGIYAPTEAHFSKAADELVAQLSQPGKLDARVSETARRYGVDPDWVKQLHETASKASLQQGISDRMRATDAQRERYNGDSPIPKHALARSQGEDSRDLRSALHASVASAPTDSLRLQITNGENASMRDVIGAAFDGYAELDAQQDPLQDDRLSDLSNAV